ncbi:MAG TPA: hypothetical protein PLR06_01660 [Cyclobacteriaceae bacterium]|nr:hypothetical protein [Cyclobacteriaceae bacterium]
MKKLLSLLFLCLYLNLQAQDTPEEKKIHYFFSVQSGLLAGKSAESITYTASTIHGVVIGNRLRVGGGLGIDSYDQWQTSPLFGSIGYDLLSYGNNGLFVQVNYGWSHGWMQKQEGTASKSAGGGKMFNAMMGYRIKAGDLSVSISAGYKFQYVFSDYTYWYTNFGSTYPGYREHIDQDIERFVFSLGIGWR